MPAPKGNQFWKARSSHGRRPIFDCPEKLWGACEQYFQWVVDNPLQEEKVFVFQGQITRANVAKMRAMTISGLCIFLGIDETTWRGYHKHKDFSLIAREAERVIRDQKFTGAAAELLNANIIARDLGLADKQDHQSTDSSMTPKGIPEDVAAALNAIAGKITGSDSEG